MQFAKYTENKEKITWKIYSYTPDIFELTCIFAIENVQIFFSIIPCEVSDDQSMGDGYQVYGQGKIQCSNTLRMDLPKLHT